ncbi:MAG: hypothetical protein BRD35_02100, partial [Bacteroidetes bacterium QH_7_62_13]
MWTLGWARASFLVWWILVVGLGAPGSYAQEAPPADTARTDSIAPVPAAQQVRPVSAAPLT